MRNRLLVICIICSLLFSVVLYLLQSNQSSIETINYFPLNETSSFTDASTKLTSEDSDFIKWTSASNTDELMYLRHDVSLLYENGFFKGVQSKWRQNEKKINFNEAVPFNKTGLFEAISFHHGEIHQSANEITSTQQMTFDQLYLNKQGQADNDRKQVKSIEQQVNKRLISTWREMIAHHDLNEANYHLIPLVNLADYETEPLPGFSAMHSKEVIGKLWEGLYKNYILRLKEKQNQSQSHMMPLIMLSKDHRHLYVLFKLNGKNEILLQQIESSPS